MLAVRPDILNMIFWIATVGFFALALLTRLVRSLRYVLPVVPIVVIVLLGLLGQWAGLRGFVDWLAAPQRLMPLGTIALVLAIMYYRRWTRPRFAGVLITLLAAGYLVSMLDAEFRTIVAKPDNIPITLMIFALALVGWVAFRRMAINDDRIASGQPPAEGTRDDRVMVWPNLVLVELIVMVVATVVLIVWAILIPAPLEPPADPTVVPNPAKAPWYFLGLQELLIYFDPWIAGVGLPLLIILGLCALPYLDKNPKGGGYYTLKERPIAIAIFLFGFLLLWVGPIIIGTFLRGPNWSFFGPFEPWDPARTAATTPVNLSEVFWLDWLGRDLPTRESIGSDRYYLVREAPGLLVLAAWFLLLPLVLRLTLFKRIGARVGGSRYMIMSLLLAAMALLPAKMLLRWLFDLKYILALTEASFNI